jgi:hypothetical protein
LKIDPAAFESGGLDVGQIVRNNIQRQLLGLHARRSGP